MCALSVAESSSPCVSSAVDVIGLRRNICTFCLSGTKRRRKNARRLAEDAADEVAAAKQQDVTGPEYGPGPYGGIGPLLQQQQQQVLYGHCPQQTFYQHHQTPS